MPSNSLAQPPNKQSQNNNHSPSFNPSEFSSPAAMFSLTQPRFIQLLKLIAISLITASVLYLVAANWFMIPKLLRIALPMMAMFAVAVMGQFGRWSSVVRQALHTVCGIMIGLTLASIGQIYQTGQTVISCFYCGRCCSLLG